MFQLDKFLDQNKTRKHIENLGYEYLDFYLHLGQRYPFQGINLHLSLLPVYGVIVIYAACASINWQQGSACWSADVDVESTGPDKEDCVPL